MTTATAVATIARIARTTYHRYAMGCLPGHLSFLFSWWLLSRYTWTGPGALTSISARSAALSVILPAAAFCTTCSALVAPPTTTGDYLELAISRSGPTNVRH